MIDLGTRARWRALFSLATVGPWAYDSAHGVIATVNGARMVIDMAPFHGEPVCESEDDLRFTAQAREAWPRTLDELEATERRLERARDEAEVLGADLRRTAALLAQVTQERDDARSRADSSTYAQRELDQATTAMSTALAAGRAREMALATALRSWVKHRYAPALVAALEAYEKSCAPST